MKIILSAFTLAFLLSSCGGSDKSKFADQNLQGHIGGEAWSFKSGKAELEDGELALTLGSENEDEPCQLGANFGESLVLSSVPDEVASRSLSLENQTVTLFDGVTNFVVIEGDIEILSRTNSKVTGRMNVRIDGENTVNGNFEATFCP